MIEVPSIHSEEVSNPTMGARGMHTYPHQDGACEFHGGAEGPMYCPTDGACGGHVHHIEEHWAVRRAVGMG